VAASTNHLTHPSLRLRRLVVGLVGLSSVAMVVLPVGYFGPLFSGVAVAIVQPVIAAPLACSMGDMAEMQMPMPADCASR
jgi:hypothetical protein